MLRIFRIYDHIFYTVIYNTIRALYEFYDCIRLFVELQTNANHCSYQSMAIWTSLPSSVHSPTPFTGTYYDTREAIHILGFTLACSRSCASHHLRRVEHGDDASGPLRQTEEECRPHIQPFALSLRDEAVF